MSARRDYYTHTESDAGRWERDHAEYDGRWIGGRFVDADDLPDRDDVEDRP